MTRMATMRKFQLLALGSLLVTAAPGVASEVCTTLTDEIKALCTKTFDGEPTYMSCAYYLKTAVDVLQKGGDETFTIDQHCKSVVDGMKRLRDRKKARGDAPDTIAVSADPRCVEWKEEVSRLCLADTLVPGGVDAYPALCFGRMGLFETSNVAECK